MNCKRNIILRAAGVTYYVLERTVLTWRQYFIVMIIFKLRRINSNIRLNDRLKPLSFIASSFLLLSY